ncbi:MULTISPECIES: hypothetical protein [Pseudomonas]|uniref:hypothetical protein n=1 Tax=Pseudomonas TaxID=286 RepID=UPI0005C4AA7B|nr:MULTISPECIES: hypothetical protein [Pseudomonas]WOB57093.1 hypothetical protein NY023_17875 [Pseudomonas sp. NBB]
MQRIDTFGEYRSKHKAARISHIHSALKILSDATYENVTGLAKGVAKIVTEIELRNHLSLPEDERLIDLKPVSHVTLLRNPDYRQILEQNYSRRVCVDAPVAISFSDYQALKIRNAGLAGQIAQLKLTIRNLDAGDVLESGDSEELKNQISLLGDDLKFLISFIDNMQSEASDIFLTVRPGEESTEFNAAGYYGVMSMVATYDELLRLEKLRQKFGA